jgi:8-oxo-dGTP pyrophosphatase MutT (NUDIX family)
MAVSIPRPAATSVVIRTASAGPGFEVLMVRRHDNVAFMGGAFVFPGGRVDEHDCANAASEQASAGASRFVDLSAEHERAHRLAAVRELQEEAGVTVSAADLVPFAHWVTPEVETRRYDTRFFVAAMPADQVAAHDDYETTEIAWLSPADAIARGTIGEILLPPPTWTTLKQLARFARVPDVFIWARPTPIVRIQPALFRSESLTMLTLPGDPTYPAIDGWEIPEDTRFLLQDGRWRPVPA